MTEWFQAGYFNMTLMVKRGCDSTLLPLGDLIKRWDRVPFTSGPPHPPIIIRRNSMAGKMSNDKKTGIPLWMMETSNFISLFDINSSSRGTQSPTECNFHAQCALGSRCPHCSSHRSYHPHSPPSPSTTTTTSTFANTRFGITVFVQRDPIL